MILFINSIHVYSKIFYGNQNMSLKGKKIYIIVLIFPYYTPIYGLLFPQSEVNVLHNGDHCLDSWVPPAASLPSSWLRSPI